MLTSRGIGGVFWLFRVFDLYFASRRFFLREGVWVYYVDMISAPSPVIEMFFLYGLDISACQTPVISFLRRLCFLFRVGRFLFCFCDICARLAYISRRSARLDNLGDIYGHGCGCDLRMIRPHSNSCYLGVFGGRFRRAVRCCPLMGRFCGSVFVKLCFWRFWGIRGGALSLKGRPFVGGSSRVLEIVS